MSSILKLKPGEGEEKMKSSSKSRSSRPKSECSIVFKQWTKNVTQE